MEKKGLVLGTIFFTLGLLILLANFDVRISEWILLAIGFVLFVMHLFVKRSNLLLVPAIYSVFTGVGVLLKTFLDPKIFYFQFSTVFLFALTLSSLVVYFAKKCKPFGVAGFILMALAIYNAAIEYFWLQGRIMAWWPLLFMLFALSFLIVFVLEYKSWGYYPIIGCVVCFVIGLLGFAKVRNLIGRNTINSVYDIIFTMWPVLLIAAGVVIIINTASRNRNKR